MSKLVCECEHVISDNTDFISYKAALINDSVEEEFFDEIVKEVNSIKDAASDGSLDQWAKDRWDSSTLVPKPEELFYDRLTGIYLKYFVTIYECEACGCLWVQEKGKQTFKPYKSKSGNYEGVLKEPESNTWSA